MAYANHDYAEEKAQYLAALDLKASNPINPVNL
jgi:hypothetical protein